MKPREIKPLTPVLPARATGFRRMGSYRLLEDVTADAWLKAVHLICEWVGDAPMFNGAVGLANDPGLQDFRALAPWSDTVAQRWADLASADMSAFQQPRNANLQAQFADRTVTFNVSGGRQRGCARDLRPLRSALHVAPRLAGDFKGERRRFYIAAGITPPWVRALINLLTAFKRSGFNGTFRIADQEYSVQDFDAWSNELLQRWQTMQAAGCTVSNKSAQHSFDIDFQREQIGLDLRTRPGVPTIKTFGDYATELNLTPAPANPYQYYRLGRRYRKIGEWNAGTDSAVADAIAESIAAAFKRGRYAFVSGSVTEGEAALEQVPQTSVDDFLGRLRRGLPFLNARLYLQGPLGHDLSVFLQRSDKIISLRSSISDGELFKEVARPFNKIHDLKEYEAETRNAAGEEQKKPSLLANAQSMVTTLGALLAILISAATFWITNAQLSKTTLDLIAPKDGLEIPGRSCPVTWSVTRKTLRHGESTDAPPAHLTVTKEGDPSYKNDLPDAASGTQITFPDDGTYDINVSIPDAEQRNARVVVKTPSDKAKQ